MMRSLRCLGVVIGGFGVVGCVADLGDGDTDPDLTTGRCVEAEVDGELRRYCAEDQLVEKEPRTVRIRDLDGDGLPELLVTAGWDDAQLSVFRGGSDGIHRAAERLDLGMRPTRPTWGDIDGDGVEDLVVGRMRETSASMYLAVSEGRYELGGTFDLGVALSDEAAPVLGDVDGDGDLDIVVAATDENEASASVIVTLLGHGDGTFQAPTRFDAGGRFFNQPTGADLLDLDGDGADEVVVTGSYVFRMTNDGGYVFLGATGLPGWGLNLAPDATLRTVGRTSCDCDLEEVETMVGRLGSDGRAEVLWSREDSADAAPQTTWVDLDADERSELLLLPWQGGRLERLDLYDEAAVISEGSVVSEGWVVFGSLDGNGDGRPDLLIAPGSDGGLVLFTAQ